MLHLRLDVQDSAVIVDGQGNTVAEGRIVPDLDRMAVTGEPGAEGNTVSIALRFEGTLLGKWDPQA